MLGCEHSGGKVLPFILIRVLEGELVPCAGVLKLLGFISSVSWGEADPFWLLLCLGSGTRTCSLSLPCSTVLLVDG